MLTLSLEGFINSCREHYRHGLEKAKVFPCGRNTRLGTIRTPEPAKAAVTDNRLQTRKEARGGVLLDQAGTKLLLSRKTAAPKYPFQVNGWWYTGLPRIPPEITAGRTNTNSAFRDSLPDQQRLLHSHNHNFPGSSINTPLGTPSDEVHLPSSGILQSALDLCTQCCFYHLRKAQNYKKKKLRGNEQQPQIKKREETFANYWMLKPFNENKTPMLTKA